MRNKCVLFVLLFIIFVSCSDDFAKLEIEPQELNKYELTSKQAEEVLYKFVNQGSKTKAGPLIDVVGYRKYTYKLNNISTRADINNECIPVYEYQIKNNMGEQGYALVVGDKRISSVIAYTENGAISDTAYIEPLRCYIENIPFIIQDKLESFNSKMTRGREPLDPEDLPEPITIFHGLNTPYWGQGSPYNSLILCNEHNNEHYGAYTGCVTTAIATILYTHQKETSYFTAEDWRYAPTSNLPTLFKKVADYAVFSTSCTKGTPGNTYTAIRAFNAFGHQTSDEMNYSIDKIKESLQRREAVYVTGSSSRVGHAWVIDGIKEETYKLGDYIYIPHAIYLRMNWGWDGRSNGWYNAGEKNFIPTQHPDRSYYRDVLKIIEIYK